MIRKAILIEASTVPNETDLPGARADANNYRDWLLSANGGAWNTSEIVILHTPARSDLIRELNLAALTEYAFVAFSGHGDHLISQSASTSRVLIHAASLVDATMLASKCNRVTVVVDACRSITHVAKADEQLLVEAFMAKDANRLARHRALFDEEVSAAEAGAVYLFACDINEASGESSNGGYFTSGLIGAGKAWSRAATARPDTLRVDQAFATAKANVETRYSGQHPQMNGMIRRRRHFPFAVVA